jgi:phage/plasmid-like protein (TIGR03299 family)
MAHNLNIRADGRASMMYVGEAPWHGLGVKLPKLATSAEVMEHAGLDYTVEKRPLFTMSSKNQLIQVNDHFCTVRADTHAVLGVVGDRYTVLQNTDAFTFFDALVGEGEAIYETAGALGRGERTWLLAKLPSYIRVGKDDIINKYLLLTNTHDGSSVVRAKLTPVRVVCENTLSVALSGSEQEVRIRHTPNAVEKLKEGYELLGLTNQLYQQLDAIFNRMQLRRVSGRELVEYVKKLVPDNPDVQKYNTRTENIRERILELHETGPGAEFTRGTVFGLLNAVSEYTDHVQHANNPEKRLKSVWFGPGADLKEKAFKEAMALIATS